MAREKAGVKEGWGRAKMAKAGYFRQSRNEWARGSDRNDAARAINQKDELNSFSDSPESEKGDVLGKQAEAWTKFSPSTRKVRLFSAFVGRPDSCTWRQPSRLSNQEGREGTSVVSLSHQGWKNWCPQPCPRKQRRRELLEGRREVLQHWLHEGQPWERDVGRGRAYRKKTP